MVRRRRAPPRRRAPAPPRGISVYHGLPVSYPQMGHGFGGFLKSLSKTVVPVANKAVTLGKQATAAVAPHLLQTGARVVQDVARGRSLASSVQRRGKATAKKVMRRGKKKVKRLVNTGKRRVRKQLASFTARGVGKKGGRKKKKKKQTIFDIL